MWTNIQLFFDYERIQRISHFPRDVFIEEILIPCIPYLLETRSVENGIPRTYQLSCLNRVLRCLFALRGTPTHLLVLWYDQDATTTRRDVNFVCKCIIKALEPKWVQWFDPNGQQYNANKGVGRFESFRNVFVAADCTLVS